MIEVAAEIYHMYVYKIPIARFALKSMNINSSSMEAHARSKWHISLVGLE